MKNLIKLKSCILVWPVERSFCRSCGANPGFDIEYEGASHAAETLHQSRCQEGSAGAARAGDTNRPYYCDSDDGTRMRGFALLLLPMCD